MLDSGNHDDKSGFETGEIPDVKTSNSIQPFVFIDF
jgi:hypothetical protein